MPDTSHNYLLVGATSGIGRAIARRLAADALRDGAAAGFVLAGRDSGELERLAADLRVRSGITTAVRPYDAEQLDAAGDFFADCVAALPGGLHHVIVCHGWLPDSDAAKRDPAVMRRLIDINYTSAVLLLEAAAAHFEQQKDSKPAGAITAISSVAGDRGRQSNYPYGASKAALSTYLQGLRNRLFHSGIAVLTVKPGFTDTAMTWGRIDPDSPLNASPDRVARSVVNAMRRRRNVIYSPWYWRLIMGVFGIIPESLFKRMKT